MTFADHLRTLPGRCPRCLLHVEAQGHRSVMDGEPTGCQDSGRLGLLLARERRDSGMSATVDAHPDDAALVDRVLTARIRRGGRFSLNEIRGQLAAVREKSVIGARVNAAARRKEIRKVDRVPSTDPATHGHEIAVWEAA